VLAKHEFSAATMADGYSRSGAGLGVVAEAHSISFRALGNHWPVGCRCWRWWVSPRPRWTVGAAFKTPVAATVH
jgi:hypothetical protein